MMKRQKRKYIMQNNGVMSYNWLFALVILCLLSACTEVVDIELIEGKERLVVDAAINWEKNTDGNEQSIYLSTSLGFFEQTSSPVIGAIVTIVNNENGVSVVFQDENNGAYTTDTFVPVLDASYTLTIVYNGETYMATEKLKQVTPIKSITKEEGVRRRVNILFDDIEGEENYYMRKVTSSYKQQPSLAVKSDENKDGLELQTAYGYDEEEVNTTIGITLYGISRPYFEYMSLIIDQSRGDISPFDVTPSEVRGNCTNIDNEDNYALGYFSLSEVVVQDFLIF